MDVTPERGDKGSLLLVLNLNPCLKVQCCTYNTREYKSHPWDKPFLSKMASAQLVLYVFLGVPVRWWWGNSIKTIYLDSRPDRPVSERAASVNYG